MQARAGGDRVEARRRAYVPDNRGLWLKTKCLNREEFVVVGWTNPEGERPHLGALLLAYQAEAGRLIYAGRVGAGIAEAELERLWQRLQPLATERMPLDVPPPRTSQFGSPFVLSRVHWVEPRLVVEVKFLTWTEEGLLRQVIYEGVREDKPRTGLPPAVETRVLRGETRRVAPTSVSPRQKKLPVPRENILQLLPDAVVPSDEQLAAYWTKVADRALPHIARRPLKLVRHVKGTTFYHMGPLPPVPDAVRQPKIEKRKGGEGTRLWVDDLAGLLVYRDRRRRDPLLGRQGRRHRAPGHAGLRSRSGARDRLEFVVESAFRLREILAGVGLDSWPKTTGGKGVHITSGLSASAATVRRLHDHQRRAVARQD